MKSNLVMIKLLDDVIVILFKLVLCLIVDCGFDVREGCYFLVVFLLIVMNVMKFSFLDCMGYECFVNLFYIEDYDDNNFFY